MKVERISRKFIKPLSPTPQNLKNFNLSFVDKCYGPNNFGAVLFYESKPGNKIELKESLEKVLVHFYPLAGRYTINDHTVDCSDQGAVFVEAEALDAELTMDLVVKNMEIETINHLLPDQCFPADAPNPLLSIQVTYIPSGGVAIAIVVSHVVLDAFSLGVFIAAWSKATVNPDRAIEITPSFDLPSLLPCKDYDFGTTSHHQVENNIAVKRLMFGKEAITRLRSKLSPNQDGKMISRVRVVSAVIAKALMSKLECAKHGETSDFVLSQSINMRERTNTPLQKHACGNLVILSLTRPIAAEEAKEIGLQELVNLIGESIEKDIADHAEILSPNQDGRDFFINNINNFLLLSRAPCTNMITFTDWSKCGFYEADFGFGKPVWTFGGMPRPVVSSIMLMSNKEGDGIEAWLYLNKNSMRFFEQDEDLKSFII